MKQILQNFNTGQLKVHDVPEPIVRDNGVLVRSHYSLISAGTEGGTVRLAKKSLVEKALDRPDLVKKVLKVVKTDGVLAAYDAVSSNLDSPVPLGYSVSGEVVAVGDGVTDLHIGDRVACFGSYFANHAEYNFVPRNLVVRLPDTIDMRHAAFCMLGAIALNGVRRAEIELGSHVLVIGLGLIGQITVQLLRASGCRVFGIDLEETKVKQALESGANQAMLRTAPSLEEALAHFSDGLGLDSVIITAATSSKDPIELAGRVTRMRGSVIALGRIPYELPRETYLFKEIDFRTTLAFGPGVNDPNYEIKGFDYPVAYVRWSGNRNVSAFIHAIAEKQLNLEPLITHEFALAEAEKAFALLSGENPENSIAILLKYDSLKPYQRSIFPIKPNRSTKPQGKLGIGILGAGSHAVSFMFDAIAAQPVNLRGIMSAGGYKSKWYGEKYQFAYVASDAAQILEDDETDAVYILSRHDSHASLSIQALNAGKHIFVEKPLCLTSDELDAIVEAQAQSGKRVMVGYNRRYSPLGRELKQAFQAHSQPLAISYRMNAGFRPANHWLHDLEVGGGLILGEAVHFIDFMQYLVDAAPTQVYAQSLHSGAGDIVDHDTVTISVRYADGSIGTLHYFSTGDVALGREHIEVFADNQMAILEDWRNLQISKGGKKRRRKLMRQDRGYSAEIQEFVASIRENREPDMSLVSILYGMQIAFSAIESLKQNTALSLGTTNPL